MANLFAPIPPVITEEIIQVLLATGNFRLERIVSNGQATPPGEWYDQDTHEWVALLSGAAGCALRTRRNPGYCAPETTSSFRPTAATGSSGPTPDAHGMAGPALPVISGAPEGPDPGGAGLCIWMRVTPPSCSPTRLHAQPQLPRPRGCHGPPGPHGHDRADPGSGKFYRGRRAVSRKTGKAPAPSQ